jgi:serine/threonine protein kinase
VRLGRQTGDRGAEVALKRLNRSKHYASLPAEITAYGKLWPHSPSLAALVEVVHTPVATYLAIEHAGSRELFDELVQAGSFAEGEGARLVRMLCRALAHCHHCGVVHRDVQPSNLMVSGARGQPTLSLRLIDFGTAEDAATAIGLFGSVEYSAYAAGDRTQVLAASRVM